MQKIVYLNYLNLECKDGERDDELESRNTVDKTILATDSYCLRNYLIANDRC